MIGCKFHNEESEMQTPEAQNGRDKYFGFLLDGKGSYREISQESASSWQAVDGQLWIHINYTDSEQSAWLKSVPNLDPLVIDALLAEETRPRTTAIGDGLLIVLRGINPNPDANPEDMVSIRIWMDKSLVITTRKRDLISVQNIIHQLKVGGGPKNTSEFLLELLDNLVLRINDTVDYFEDKIAELEELVLSNSGNEIRNDLATLRRQAITIKRYLAPQREAVSRLITEKAEWIDDSVRLNLRETNDRLIRHIEDIDAVRERAAVTQ